ncbi:MAG: hypothetical protein RID81_06835 [Sandaracinaceae bacterium]
MDSEKIEKGRARARVGTIWTYPIAPKPGKGTRERTVIVVDVVGHQAIVHAHPEGAGRRSAVRLDKWATEGGVWAPQRRHDLEALAAEERYREEREAAKAHAAEGEPGEEAGADAGLLTYTRERFDRLEGRIATLEGLLVEALAARENARPNPNQIALGV